MPYRAPRLRPCCGTILPHGERCACQIKAADARKARHEAQRPSARERGYDSKWDRERRAYLVLNPICRRCGALAGVVDHIIPHRGDMRLFWSRSNWQPLCKPCHDRAKQAQEKRGRYACD